jgi:hypothetical protein
VWARRYGVLSCGNVGIAVGELNCLGKVATLVCFASVTFRNGRMGLCAGFKLEIRNAKGWGWVGDELVGRLLGLGYWTIEWERTC